MPIEIKELVIRASVTGDPRPGASVLEAGAVAAGTRHPAPPARPLSPAEMERIVDACLKRALKVWKRSQER